MIFRADRFWEISDQEIDGLSIEDLREYLKLSRDCVIEFRGDLGLGNEVIKIYRIVKRHKVIAGGIATYLMAGAAPGWWEYIKAAIWALQ